MWFSTLKIAAATLLAAATLAVAGSSLAPRPPAGKLSAQAATGRPAKDPAPGPRPAETLPPRAVVAAVDEKAEEPALYPFKTETLYELPSLTINDRNLHLQLETGPVTVVPIVTEPGTTGALVIGRGTYRFVPDASTNVSGTFHAAMLRFNPADQAGILPLSKGKKLDDRGVLEMSRHLLSVVVRHCWQGTNRGRQQVLIPPRGTTAAVLYSNNHGDLLISGDERTAVAFSFTDRKTLYEKK